MGKHAVLGNYLKVSAVAAVCLATIPAVFGATLTWDPSQSGGGSNGGSGTWSTASNWWSGSQDQAWNNANADVAAFAGTAGSVTLGGSQSTNGIIFASAGGYTLGGGTLVLAGATPFFSVATSAGNAIGSVVSGVGPLSIQAGSGSLLLGGSNNYTGGTSLNSGTLSVNGDAALAQLQAPQPRTSRSTAASSISPPPPVSTQTAPCRWAPRAARLA